MILVLGGSGSGKSAYAEELATECAKNREKRGGLYYLATMQAYDEESKKRVARHRKLRAGKGFITIEQPRDICGAAQAIPSRIRQEKSAVLLLECVSNLVANEMFGEAIRPEGIVAKKVASEMKKLEESASQLIVVSNNVFEDGVSYEETTLSYLRALGRINQELAAAADKVIEVVAGIPVVWKEKR